MYTLRKLLFSALAVFTLVAFVGCDSDDDDDPADVFVGAWTVTSITDGDGDQTAAFGQVANSLDVTFADDGTFDLVLDYNDIANAAGQADLAVDGTYTATDTRLSLTVPALGATLPFDYNVVNNDQVGLSAPAAIVNAAFGTSYVGNVTLTVTRR